MTLFRHSFWLIIATLLIGGVGCKKEQKSAVLSRVIDLTFSDPQERQLLEYDAEGRIVKYGKMEFVYGNNQISFKFSESEQAENFKDFSASCIVLKGKIVEILATFQTILDETPCTINKHTYYDYKADTILVSSDYRMIATGKLVKAVRRKCILDDQKRVVKMDASREGMNDSIWSCTRLFHYENNLQHNANLNLTAYSLALSEPDDFMFFLLNLGKVINSTQIPNTVDYEINEGSDNFAISGRYGFQEENPTRIELFKNDQRLLRRLVLEYTN
ncbi:MAG: hypothetical protein ACRC3Z_05740 [Phocaeicola sp.]